MWPAGYPAATWPWPDLIELTLSCPQAKDRIYRELPNSLRSLSLQYTPHYMDYAWTRATGHSSNAHWQWPLLTTSDMLCILRQCRLPALRHLALEYLEGDSEEQLLKYIALAFPQLTSLKLRRCHWVVDGGDNRERQDPWAVAERICQPISSLRHLRSLAMHLDLEETPYPFSPYQFEQPYDDEDLGSFYNTLHEVADRMALVFGPELEEIKLWRPHDYDIYEWKCYEVVRSSDFGTFVR
ncbi:hypothetical protein ONZ51_g6709 [Trametes cubensis]|uniref:F-box domain-containing protein n=1 Tax=Trametes cubensis TaxID=1111947 RepID=A0AAD7TRQ0_9APHY|nr:hypothetical protein ONZ51_g6709 [Trametes cubensis]